MIVCNQQFYGEQAELLRLAGEREKEAKTLKEQAVRPIRKS